MVLQKVSTSVVVVLLLSASICDCSNECREGISGGHLEAGFEAKHVRLRAAT